jgi:hypothetical protein
LKIKKRETGNGERKTRRFPLTVPRFTQNDAFSGAILLRPVFFLVAIFTELFLPLVLIHLLLALLPSPGHVSLRSSSAPRVRRAAFHLQI